LHPIAAQANPAPQQVSQPLQQQGQVFRLMEELKALKQRVDQNPDDEELQKQYKLKQTAAN
jgi:flagellar motor protein MotB